MSPSPKKSYRVGDVISTGEDAYQSTAADTIEDCQDANPITSEMKRIEKKTEQMVIKQRELTESLEEASEDYREVYKLLRVF